MLRLTSKGNQPTLQMPVRTIAEGPGHRILPVLPPLPFKSTLSPTMNGRVRNCTAGKDLDHADSPLSAPKEVPCSALGCICHSRTQAQAK